MYLERSLYDLCWQDCKFHYVENGSPSKIMVLCLHDFTDFWYGWRNQLRGLSESFRVVALDLKGFGDSEKPFLGIDHQTKSLNILSGCHFDLLMTHVFWCSWSSQELLWWGDSLRDQEVYWCSSGGRQADCSHWSRSGRLHWLEVCGEVSWEGPQVHLHLSSTSQGLAESCHEVLELLDSEQMALRMSSSIPAWAHHGGQWSGDIWQEISEVEQHSWPGQLLSFWQRGLQIHILSASGLARPHQLLPQPSSGRHQSATSWGRSQSRWGSLHRWQHGSSRGAQPSLAVS